MIGMALVDVNRPGFSPQNSQIEAHFILFDRFGEPGGAVVDGQPIFGLDAAYRAFAEAMLGSGRRVWDDVEIDFGDPITIGLND